MKDRQRKFKYVRNATGDDVAKAIQDMLDAHCGMRNPYCAVDWKPDGALVEMHFEPWMTDSSISGAGDSVRSAIAIAS